MWTLRARNATTLPGILIAAALLVAASANPAHAQLKTSFQYSVKALCTLFGSIGFGDALSPGAIAL